jgi:putative spermidine/putrescine transport system ATP-binding protein
VEQVARPHEAYESPATAFVASFLGKTNHLRVNGTELVVRPERIRFSSDASALAGRVVARIFQGNHWLYHVETEAGRVTVIRQNSGDAVPAEGENVRLAW